ncbi:olfactory receptor 4N5-like [Petaurus breviceps papuanus]|uniref:olfactory receptor 4N5-like n=1 Tax=Petaurus breviceps papuanus TaxID=3040969 RepID=UPI0036DC4E53
MELENNTVTEFILLGLTQSKEIQLLVFVLIFSFYMIILPGNLLIIITIRTNPALTAPLYFFLGNLAFLDASYSFIVAPKMLADFLYEKKTISYQGCITQLFFLHFLGVGEMFLLVVMAFDRYIAICQPLRYAAIMNRQVCYVLLLALWVGGFTHSIVQVALIVHLPFCGPNQLDNFFSLIRATSWHQLQNCEEHSSTSATSSTTPALLLSPGQPPKTLTKIQAGKSKRILPQHQQRDSCNSPLVAP